MVEQNLPANVNESEQNDWSDIKTLEQALAVIESNGLVVEDISDEVGDGFELVKDHSTLIGVPFLIIGWRTSPGDFGDFVSIRCIGKPGSPFEGQKFVFNDGSTGIKDQLWKIEKRKGLESYKNWITVPMNANKGLRVSEYEYEAADPKTGELVKRPAKTYYFA